MAEASFPVADFPQQPCLNPSCGKLLDAGFRPALKPTGKPLQSDGPKPGNFTVCMDCGHVMVFGEALVLREPNDAEILKLAGNKSMLLIQEARVRLNKERRRNAD